MLSFKVKKSTHQTISSATKYLCYTAYIGGLVFFAYTMFSNYRQAGMILDDPVITTAAVTLDDVTVEKGRKGRRTETYHFTYAYEVGGETFEQSFTTSESNAAKYLDQESVEIAYAKSQPALSGKRQQLEKNHSIGSILWRFALAFFLLMFLVYAVYMIITAKLFVVRDASSEQA